MQGRRNYSTWLYHPAKPAQLFHDVSEVELARLNDDGWRDSPVKVGRNVPIVKPDDAPPPVAPVEPEPPESADEKDQLITRALALGLRANRRYSVETLRTMIGEAQAAQDGNNQSPD